jgi:hypothetical protein
MKKSVESLLFEDNPNDVELLANPEPIAMPIEAA